MNTFLSQGARRTEYYQWTSPLCFCAAIFLLRSASFFHSQVNVFLSTSFRIRFPRFFLTMFFPLHPPLRRAARAGAGAVHSAGFHGKPNLCSCHGYENSASCLLLMLVVLQHNNVTTVQRAKF